MNRRYTSFLILFALACDADKTDDSGSPVDTGTTVDSGQNDTGSSDTATDFAANCTASNFAENLLCTQWMYNPNNEVSAVIKDTDGGDILVNVQDAEPISENGMDYMRISASGIPNYQVTVTQDLIDELQARPKADQGDFGSASGPTIAVGDSVMFGQDIGYESSSRCDVGAGFGYWPPGPSCPEDTRKDFLFPLDPHAAASGQECEIGLGPGGLFVNGVSIYNWGDAQSYDTSGLWENNAAFFENFDLDICRGHSANGDYHHHDYPRCLADQLQEDGSGHSKVYGFMADGYPIHGPYSASGQEAQSCWVTRDYNDPSDPLGCGGTGQRSCFLVDAENSDLGTTPADTFGPNTDETVTSLSGHQFIAASGYYKQDYYFDVNCGNQSSAGINLDKHNGHNHDAIGYHYHITHSFPFFAGPTLYGAVPGNSFVTCMSGQGGGNQGGGQGGQGGNQGGGNQGGGQGGGQGGNQGGGQQGGQGGQQGGGQGGN